MKKTLLALAMVAMGVCSCSTNEEVGELLTHRPISFDIYTNITRGSDVTTSNLGSFAATAFGNSGVYFDSVSFAKPSGKTNWESTPVWYWPAFNLEFAAWTVPATTKYTTAADSATNFIFKKGTRDSDTTLVVKIPKNLDKQEDLVAAYKASSSAPTTAGDPVSLTFNHYMTQVTVNASNYNENYIVKVKAVKIANLADSGKYYFKRGKMIAESTEVNTAKSSDFVYTLSSETTLNSPTKTKAVPDSTNLLGGGNWYLIPQTVTAWNTSTEKTNASHGTYLAFLVNITTSTGALVYPATKASSGYTADGYAWTAVAIPSSLALAQGKKYNVTVHFFKQGGAGNQDPETTVPSSPGPGNQPIDTSKPIIFSSTVSAWGDAVGVTIDL